MNTKHKKILADIRKIIQSEARHNWRLNIRDTSYVKGVSDALAQLNTLSPAMCEKIDLLFSKVNFPWIDESERVFKQVFKRVFQSVLGADEESIDLFGDRVVYFRSKNGSVGVVGRFELASAIIETVSMVFHCTSVEERNYRREGANRCFFAECDTEKYDVAPDSTWGNAYLAIRETVKCS